MRSPYSLNKNQRHGPPPGLVNSLILGCIYGYFAMRFHQDSVNCYANDNKDDRIDADTADKSDVDSTTNIGGKFGFSFQLLFFMTVIEVAISMFAYSISVQINA